MNKAVIPCGGLGTRFLPITKTVPKELLPIVDVPVISHIIDECVSSGLTEVLIIISPHKEIIKDYFKRDDRLYDELMGKGKTELAEILLSASSKADIKFVTQYEPLGSAHAVSLARDFTGDEPFCLALGDDLTVSEVPVAKQMIEAYEKTHSTIIGVQKCEGDDIVKYGVADVVSNYDRHNLLRGIVEKPPLNALPSRLACYGRYILSNIYKYIDRTPKGKGGEYQLTDALMLQCQEEKVYAYEFEGKRYDMGDKFGALKAAIELSLNRKDFGDDLKSYIKELAATL
ncbi:MAG: UTP--glucose-1-phosphate uridylyltransferase [Clostridiales bacterium]|nr:UTP--glucose-1-phosphate uridylyltransferase [Clostridiales bacterium]